MRNAECGIEIEIQAEVQIFNLGLDFNSEFRIPNSAFGGFRIPHSYRPMSRKIVIRQRENGDQQPPPGPGKSPSKTPFRNRIEDVKTPGNAPRMRKPLLWGGAAAILLAALAWLIFDGKNPSPDAEDHLQIPAVPDSGLVRQPLPDLSKYQIDEDVFRENKPLESFLKEQQLQEGVVARLKEQAAEAGLTTLEKGHRVLLLQPKDASAGYRFFIYEMSPGVSAYIHPFPLPEVKIHRQSLERRVKGVGAVIKTTLWDAVYDRHLNPKIISQMEDAMKWSLDFYHLQPGDKFKLIYEEVLAGEAVAEIGQLRAVWFETAQGTYSAFFVEKMEKPGFLDDNGAPVRKTFLKCPVRYERITSHYDPARLHPVLKTVRPHFGTDYAAPRNAPIFAVGDGEVIAADFTENNGNYVKIRHDATYTTQYLHMDHFAEGIRRGSKVQQGQVIGYVGDTGLATGPHVCFRFWKNEKQVDHLKEDINRPLVMSLREEDAFLEIKSALMQQIDSIAYFGGNL